ncbi:MAG TPA: cell wall hydrolase [Caulobacteraceae bacterium]|jgi:spore germination cell wall hydrolase CwlJ-like protein
MEASATARRDLPHLALTVFAAVLLIALTPFGQQALKLLTSMSFGGAAWADTAGPGLQQHLPPGSVSPFILRTSDVADREQAVTCLSEAIYYEAAFEPLDGQRAVAQVVVNRVRDPNFPNTVCGVVYQGWQRKTGCQFTFACDGSLRRRPPSTEQLERVRPIAERALDGYVAVEVGTATHYHTDWVHPYWAPTLDRVAQVGDHVFYKWKGRAGQPEALKVAYDGGEAEAWSRIAPGLYSRYA